MKTFAPRLDVLPPEQRALWHELAPAARLGFALYGGTAVALRLGHRQSVDFDFFSEAPLDREALRDALAFLRGSRVVRERPDSLGVQVQSGAAGAGVVKVSFFGRISFGRVGEPERTDDGVAVIASLEDLLATKVKVILQRAEMKDYQDIACMLRAGTDLPRALAGARALYGEAFQPSESLRALVFFEDGNLTRLPRSDKSTLVAAAAAVRELPGVRLKGYQLGLGRERGRSGPGLGP